MDSKTVKHIARLSRIKLSANEEEKIKDDLSSILNFVELLNKVSTEDIEPLYRNTGLLNSVRSDDYRQDFNIEAKLTNNLTGQAPEKERGFVKVRSVLNK